MPAGLAWACNNARSDTRSRLSRDRHIAELLVFPGDVRAFGLSMDARAGDALGEVAPVRRLERTCARMARRAGLDQLIARGDNPLPAGRRSRFDNHKRVCGQLPELLQNRMPSFRRKLVQDVGHSDQIARFAVDGVNGNIRNAPGDVRQLSFRR